MRNHECRRWLLLAKTKRTYQVSELSQREMHDAMAIVEALSAILDHSLAVDSMAKTTSSPGKYKAQKLSVYIPSVALDQHICLTCLKYICHKPAPYPLGVEVTSINSTGGPSIARFTSSVPSR